MTDPDFPDTVIDPEQPRRPRADVSRSRGAAFAVSASALVPLLIWAANFLLVGNPVRRELASDSRNESYKLVAHYRYYIDLSTLVLDLRRVDALAPADLFRGLFQSAKALHQSGRSFSRVILARSRSPVFIMKGEDFQALGEDVGRGENPVYLIRTLPQKLFKPDGDPAFSSWTGGLIGVTLRQIEDANEGARQWATGR